MPSSQAASGCGARRHARLRRLTRPPAALRPRRPALAEEPLLTGRPGQDQPLRDRLYELAQAGLPFSAWYSDPSSAYFSIYGRTFIASETSFFSEYSDAQICQAISDGWAAFLDDDLPMIMAKVRAAVL